MSGHETTVVLVLLLTGFTRDELDDLGGVPE